MSPTSPDAPADIAAIHHLKARYCRFVDTKQWDRLRALFTEDARLEGFGSVPDGADPAAFVAGVSAYLAHALTIHRVQSPEIELRGPNAARGLWAMMDYVDLHPDAAPPDGGQNRGWMGWGAYEEDYVCVDGTWRIAYMRLARQRLDWLAADHPRAAYNRHAPRPNWL